MFWSQKRSPAEEEEGRQGILSVFIFFHHPPLNPPSLAKGLREGNWCNQSAGWGFPPPPSPARLALLAGSLQCVCVWGRGWGEVVLLLCSWLWLQPGERARERARDREGESERERERSRDRVSGAAHSAGTAAADTHTGRERRSLQAKGGNLHRRLDSQEFLRGGAAGGMRWVLFCVG